MRASITSLQAGRGIAALMVVLFHLNNYVLPSRLYAGEDLHSVFGFGYAGVEFFFALSGFIMMFVHRADFGKARVFPSFAWKRIVRIYPIYWFVILGLFSAWAILPGTGPDTPAPLSIMAYNATLLPTDGEPLLGVAWTLQHEMLFYAFFSLVILTRRIGLGLMLAWFAACFGALLIPGTPAFPASFLLSHYNIIFLFGILAALGYRRLARDQALVALLGGITLFLAVGLGDVYFTMLYSEAWRGVFFGAAASSIIAGACALEQAGRLHSPGWLKRLGDSSYSLYLVHMPVFVAVVPILNKLGLSAIVPLPVMAVLLLAIALTSGWILHSVVEKPLMRLLNRARPGRRLGLEKS